MTLTTRQLYFEAVKVGDELPPLVKPPVDRLQVARYVGAAQDWNPLYIDELHARAAGFPSAFAPGVLAMGFMGELVTDWVRGARLRRFQGRFVKIVWPGDVLTVRGRVTDRRFEANGAYAVDIEAWAENQRGELVTRGLATFQLYYSAEDEARQRSGQGPLLVTPQEEEARLARLSRAQPPRPVIPSRPLQPPRPIAPPPPAPPAAPRPAVPPPAPAPARPAAAVPPRPEPKVAPKPAPRPPAGPAPRPASGKAATKAARPVARKPAGKSGRPAAGKGAASKTPAKPAARTSTAGKTKKAGGKKKR